MNETQPRDFNKAAANWDEKPERRQLAAAVAAGIAAAIPLHRAMRALEFGCGTGLVGLQLAGRVGQLTAVDTAQGMLHELREKSRALGVDNVTPLLLSDERARLPESVYDLLFASMVLHHIADFASLLQQFHAVLGPEGYLAIADLESEDGSFHDNPHGIAHHGFDRAALMAMLKQLGFISLEDRTVHIVRKKRGAGVKAYPVFLITGKKA